MSDPALTDWKQSLCMVDPSDRPGGIETILQMTWTGKMTTDIDVGKEGDGQPEPAHGQQSRAHHEHARHSKDEHI